MRKITKFIFIFVLICMPLNVLACPHLDSEGNQHLQTYSSDYTIMNMIYPMEGYLYTKIVTMQLDGVYITANEDNVISEGFGFAIYQDLSTYMGYYWFMDESYVTTDYEDLDIEVTVENTESQYVSGTGYSFNVFLTNTYEAGITLENEITNQIYYEVLTDQLTTDERSEEQSLFISENNLVLANEEILLVSADFLHVEIDSYLYTTTYYNIYDLYDDIEVCLESEIALENPEVVNLDNFTGEEDFIEVSYNKEENCYDFVISEVGSYVIVEKFDIVYTSDVSDKLTNELVIEDENSSVVEESDDEILKLDAVENDSNYTNLIVVGSSVSLVIIGVVVFVVLKKRK